MKGWKITKPLNLEETEITDIAVKESSVSKVKITKALITLSDLLRYRGDINCGNIVLGSSGIGIISETESNLFDIEKGKRIYVDPKRQCGKCYNCIDGNSNKCSNLQIAGKDFDGFLSDFIEVSPENLFVLPDSVSDVDALFIDHVSLALSVIDNLNVQKGDYVAIVGANNFANVLAQLMIYYQAVPIVLTDNEEDYETVKNSGVYYVLGPNDNWQKEVASITSGRFTEKVVYISECDIPIAKAFSLASVNGSLAYMGETAKASSVSFVQAVKKQLDIRCINNGFGNTTSSINLLANKAINVGKLKLANADYNNIPETFNNLNAEYSKTEKFTETVVKLF